MSFDGKTLRLLLMGAGSRLSIALLIAALVWLGFLWATTTPGAV